jgi:hypothetical protein
MIEEILKYIAVFLTSACKFIAGPLLGVGSGLLFSVVIFSNLLGKLFKIWICKTFYKNSKLFSKKNRRLIKIWRSYGIRGVAFLTPILLSPIGGTLLAASFGESRGKIFFYMLLSSIFWSFIFTFGLFALKNGQFMASLH